MSTEAAWTEAWASVRFGAATKESARKLFDAGVNAERERCAKEADAAADRVFDEEAIGACRYIAAAIRKEPA